jgi:putative ABC transport system ATP-binding protein
MKIAMSQQKLIDLKEVWKTYTLGDTIVHALRGLDLTVKRGEFIAIMGPSGSGKSTLVNMVGCLDTPSKGSVHLKEKNIAAMSESQLAQVRGKTIGFIFQSFNLIGTLSALENVTLPMVFQGLSETARKARAKQLLERVDLGDRSGHLPNQLSGGQQQRVAIARALSNDPEVILADEPTGNLDSKTGNIIMQLIQNLHKKEKKTIILVTHDSGLAKYATRVVHVKDGLITQQRRRVSA